MVCGPETTQSLSAVFWVAYGSVLLTPVSPCNIYAMPTPSALKSCFLFIHASRQASQALSRHMGPMPFIAGGVGKQVYAPSPCLSTLPCQSLTVSVLAIAGGAALSASRIVDC